MGQANIGEPLFTREQLTAWLAEQGIEAARTRRVVIDLDVDNFNDGPDVEIEYYISNEAGSRYLITDHRTGERVPAMFLKRIRMTYGWLSSLCAS